MMIKRISAILFLFVLAAFVSAEAQTAAGVEGRPTLLSAVSNDKAAQDVMISNTYRIVSEEPAPEPEHKGEVKTSFGSAFRLHRNWFLTCAHGNLEFSNVRVRNQNNKKEGFYPVKVSVKQRKFVPGTAAPFTIIIERPQSNQEANGKIFFLNADLKLDKTNKNRGEDLALVYVSDKDPSARDLKPADDFLKIAGGLVPEEMLSGIKNVKRAASGEWDAFMRHTIPPYQLFILSERTIVDELVPFPLTTYYIPIDVDGRGNYDTNGREIVRFVFRANGTRKNTDAIFYERVNNLIPGTSGSPMTYGKYVVSVDSATNCSPMLTDKFHDFLKRTMGKDYSAGMCVRPMEQEVTGNEVPIIVPHRVKKDKNWNRG